jgi:hypothetical protein
VDSLLLAPLVAPVSTELPFEDVIDAEARAKGRAERLARKAAKAKERADQTVAAALAQRGREEARAAASALTALQAQEVDDAAAERARAKLVAKRSLRTATKLQEKTALKDEKTARRQAVAKAKKAKKSAKAARLQTAAVLEVEAELGSESGSPQTTMVDSGASDTFLTTASARAAQLEGNVRVTVSDAQGKVFNAYGGGALFGMIKDKDGEWRKEQVAINAYESPAFADDLLSWPSLKKLGWTLRSGPREGKDFLTSPDNRHYPLTSDSAGLLFLDISLCPRGSSARSTARVDIPESRRAFMAVLSPGKPRRIDSRKRQVRWAENFATAGRWVKRLLTGGGATGGVDNGGVDAAVDVFSPEPTLDSELVERTDVDVIELTAEDERKAFADS